MFENYPYNIAVSHDCSLYIGVGNHLGSPTYYTIYVKLLNQADLLPSTNSATPSSLPAIYEYKFFLANNENQEAPLTFSISEASTNGDQATINQLVINNTPFNVNKLTIWNGDSTGFYCRLLCELWVYNATIGSLQFHNRAVSLQLNLARQ